MSTQTSAPAKSARKSHSPFPPHYRRLSPLAKLQWLKSDEAKLLVSASQLQQLDVDAAIKQLHRNDRRISRIVPSPCWLEQFQEGWAFPPRAEKTPMLPAINMLRPHKIFFIGEEQFQGEYETLWPQNFLTADGTTFDLVADWIEHTEKKMDLAPSHRPASYALQRMQALGISLGETLDPEFAIQPESEAALKIEIAAHQQLAAHIEKQLIAPGTITTAQTVPLAPSL